MSIRRPRRACAAAVTLVGFVVGSAAFAEPLSLEDCMRLALRHNLTAESARVDLRSANADVARARSAFLPRVDVGGTWSKSEEAIEVFQGGELRFFDETWNLDARASLTLFDGLGNVWGYREASQSRAAARDRVSRARQDVAYETERRFFEVRRQSALLEVQKKAVEASAEQLKKTNAMKDLGAATRADVLKTEVTHANDQLEELRTERALEVAKGALATYIGRNPSDDLDIVPEEPTVGDELPLDAAVAEAIEHSPGLTAARANRDARRSAVRQAKSERYPSLAAWANTDYFNFELSDFDDEHIEWRYGVSMDFTVFDGMLTKSNIRTAEAELHRATRAAESQERDVIFAVRQAWFDTEIARRTIVVAENGVRSSEEDFRLAQERYRLGEGTILDVIDAQVNLTRTRSSLVTARYDARLAQSRLRSAIGNLAVPEPSE